MSGAPSFAPVVCAESLRWRRSIARRLLVAPAVYSSVVAAMLLLAGPVTSWQQVTAWDNVWSVAVGPVFAVLLGVTVARDDIRSRCGGTAWVPVPVRTSRVARAILLAAHVLVANLLALTGPVVAAVVSGATVGARPGRMLLLAAVCTIGMVPAGLLGQAVTRRASAGAGAVVGCCAVLSWTVIGSVEGPWWALWPGNWIVRPTLRLTGTHANGTALAADDPLWHASVSAPLVLSLGAAVLLCVAQVPRFGLPAVTGPLRAHGQPVAARRNRDLPAQVRIRPRPGLALWLAVARRGGTWLAPAATGAALCLLRWQDASTVAVVLVVVVLPLAASLAPVLVWRTLAPAWRQVACSPLGVDDPARRVTAALWGGVSGCVLAGLAGLAAAGLPLHAAARLGVNAVMVTGLLCVISSWVTVCYGTAVASALGAVGTLLATLVGATGLMGRLWPLTPWAWGVLPVGRQQLVAAVIVLSVVLFGLATLGDATRRLARADA